MRSITTGIIALFAVAIGGYGEACGKPGDDSTPKDDIYHVTLSDGSELRIGICWHARKEEEKTVVGVYLYSKNADKWSITWTRDLTSVDYAPEREPYYTLVKEMKDRIFIFSTWNSQYSIIDKRNGQVLKKGDGDAVLREYDSLVPLKLTIPRSHGTALHGWKAAKFWLDMLISLRQSSTFMFSQPIAGSKLKKFYVVQFETHRDKRPAPDWRPVFVIVWKAEELESIDLDNLAINGQSVRPPSGKNAIYALQRDYSLQQFPLTAEETTRLFSHITNVEKRLDQRLASVSKLVEQQDPPSHWREKLFSVIADEKYFSTTGEQLFPSDSYWEKKVDPRLKIVEPPKK